MEYLHLLILKLKPHFTIQSKDTKEKRLSMIKHVRKKCGENDHTNSGGKKVEKMVCAVVWKDKEATCQQPKKQILAVHFYGFYRHFYELEFGKTFV